MSKPKFLLDANVLIEASRRYYSFDFGTKFWDFLKAKAQEGLVGSIDKVLNELKEGKDPLKEWAEKEFKPFFYSTQSDQVFQEYQNIVKLVQEDDQYSPSAKEDFMKDDNADPWLIAYAKCYSSTIVTQEVYRPNAKSKVPIPNVCVKLNVKWIDLFTMLKLLRFKL
ncbi:MAG: DUF4411 family protein [Thermoplasmata archaeon]